MDDREVKCQLCPHHCILGAGSSGRCGVRKNVDGKLLAMAYGHYPAVHIDPIEKKPLNHFVPGSSILSLGSIGCNLNCLHCQNWSLARTRAGEVPVETLDMDDLLNIAGRKGSIGVAFTYNEPTINFEYVLEASRRLRKNGSKAVLVTNGYLEDAPWKELMEVTDGANIDVKGFTEEFYREITGGDLESVKRNVETAVKMGVHVEIAYLVIPGKNDDGEETDRFIEWVLKDLSDEVPVHFNRFHPDHRMLDVPPTSPEILLSLKEKARKKGIKYVFIGNLGGSGLNDTDCPSCGRKVVKRDGFFGPKVHLRDATCPWCKTKLKGVWS